MIQSVLFIGASLVSYNDNLIPTGLPGATARGRQPRPSLLFCLKGGVLQIRIQSARNCLQDMSRNKLTTRIQRRQFWLSCQI